MSNGKKMFKKRIEDIKNGDLNLIDWSGIMDLLAEVDMSNVRDLMPMLPCLLKHQAWPVRAEAIEIVGSCRIRKFLKFAKKMLQDKNNHVKAYALVAIYDLERNNALKYIKHFIHDQNIRIRINALTLLYVEERTPETLSEIRKIVLRKNCDYHHQFNAINQFKHYLKIKNCPEIIKLYKDMLKNALPSSGVVKELKNILREV
jgi:hypothetical protein